MCMMSHIPDTIVYYTFVPLGQACQTFGSWAACNPFVPFFTVYNKYDCSTYTDITIDFIIKLSGNNLNSS